MAGSMEVSSYLGEDAQPDGTRHERRSESLTFTLAGTSKPRWD